MEVLEKNATKEHGDLETILVAPLENFGNTLGHVLLNVLLLEVLVLR